MHKDIDDSNGHTITARESRPGADKEDEGLPLQVRSTTDEYHVSALTFLLFSAFFVTIASPHHETNSLLPTPTLTLTQTLLSVCIHRIYT